MTLLFGLSLLLGIVAAASLDDPVDLSPQLSCDKPNGGPTLLNLKFYTRMSFYTPEDDIASVIVDALFNYCEGEQLQKTFWFQYDAYGYVPVTVTEGDTNEQIIDWQNLEPNTTGTEFSFSLKRFPPREEGYTLHLLSYSDEFELLFERTTILRVLDQHDRLGHILHFGRDWQYSENGTQPLPTGTEAETGHNDTKPWHTNTEPDYNSTTSSSSSCSSDTDSDDDRVYDDGGWEQ
ncbi:hypothetical protein K469DRAFT_746109 [Zopfia rhizophila CBS 207.26]|uniref:Uncharacterized protein n=1 Tax=Zopfia rhizophila CBS 207.26 TaxID=1314779 RepID=A0A6A6ES93_9PEZI|nr:hypothetical protein K469DRAFT_746109 [Zopfia rhizophila CBS 207.26]